MKSLRVGIKNEMGIWRKNAVYNLRFLRFSFEQMFVFPLLYDSLFPIHFHRFCSRIFFVLFHLLYWAPYRCNFHHFHVFPFSARTVLHGVVFPCALFVSFTIWVVVVVIAAALVDATFIHISFNISIGDIRENCSSQILMF